MNSTSNLQSGRQPVKAPGLDVGPQADALLDRAQEVHSEQDAMLGATPLESQYSAAFTAQLEAKHDQAERLEDRLETLVDQQSSQLQQTRSSQPGILAMPGVRNRWQARVQQQQSTMQRLQGRLEAVREIKDGMGLYSPRIEEMATRKLRAEEPELAKDWDDMREAQRLHQLLMRKHEQEQKQAMERERGEEVSRGLRLAFIQSR